MTRDAAWSVVEDIAVRRNVGLDKYNKLVSAEDLDENWIQHAYEEVLDKAVYMRAAVDRDKVQRQRLAMLEKAVETTFLKLAELHRLMPDYDKRQVVHDTIEYLRTLVEK